MHLFWHVLVHWPISPCEKLNWLEDDDGVDFETGGLIAAV